MSELLTVAKDATGAWVVQNVPGFVCRDNVDKTTAEQTLFGAVETHYPGQYRIDRTLDEAKAERFLQIDLRTDAIIAGGFTFSGAQYSLSNEAQGRFLAMLVAADYLTYPILYNSIDDVTKLEIPNADTVRYFVFTAMGTMRVYLDSGTQIKDAVRDATGVDDVYAVVDPR